MCGLLYGRGCYCCSTPPAVSYGIKGKSRVVLRGSTCPHGPPRPVNCDRRRVLAKPAQMRRRHRSRHASPQAVPGPWIYAGHSLVPLASGPASLATLWHSARRHARRKRSCTTQRGSPSIATGRRRAGSQRLSTKPPTKGQPTSWPHQARPRRGAQPRPGPSTPTLSTSWPNGEKRRR